MTQNVHDLLPRVVARQNVERVLPRVPFWSRLLTWAVFCGLGWVITVIFCGGILYWLDVLQRWAR